MTPCEVGRSTMDRPDRFTRGLEQSELAHLSCTAIEGLSRAEMIAAIRVAELPRMDADNMAHLEYLDRPHLMRMVYMARECCRHRVQGVFVLRFEPAAVEPAAEDESHAETYRRSSCR